ncbi:hypothetical protein QR685DRAFT_541577 [Neurospora intermedia]|uniref:Uncharacterized protein n=1 Tax=Neurospora intermedia TaxID=5142 RepID=A0ABR3DJS9_NEUIN
MTTNIPLGALALLLVALSSTSSVFVSAIPVSVSRDVIRNGTIANTTANTTVVPYAAPVSQSELSTTAVPSLLPNSDNSTNNSTDTSTSTEVNSNGTVTGPSTNAENHHHYDPSAVVESVLGIVALVMLCLVWLYLHGEKQCGGGRGPRQMRGGRVRSVRR